MATDDSIPYWCQNLPRDRWPEKCPDFLQNVTERDKRIMGTPDSDYHILTWEECVDLVKRDKIDDFQRKPSELRRYRQFTYELVRDYGSITDFMQKQRLKWDLLDPEESTPFANPADLKILCNDWPYGVDERIAHLVVWVKFELPEDPETGRLYPHVRRQIDEYVKETFGPHVRDEHLVWFRNWTSIKSVHALEHFHVMLFDPDEKFVEKITNGDVPLSARVPLNVG